MKHGIIFAMTLAMVGLYIFADQAVLSARCEKGTLAVMAKIEILPYTKTNAIAYTSWLVPKKSDPIDKVLNLKTGKLVKIATLKVNLNFEHLVVYVNVNRRSIMRFVEDSGINSNGMIVQSIHYGEDVYFTVSSKMEREKNGMYSLEVNVEMLNSKARQWALSLKYAVPIEFTLLRWANPTFATERKYEPYTF